jgi:outer membrane protein OmpA-like peptidoglycan-associated protein
MRHTSETEFEDELELLNLEDAPERDTPKWNKPSLLEFRTAPTPLGTAFGARVSGFDSKKATAPPEAYDRGRPVLQLHRDAVTRIVNEIKARTTPTNCVSLRVLGFADPGGESAIAKDISARRAEAFSRQIWEQILTELPEDNRNRIKRKIWEGRGAASPIWPSDTPAHRHLNRRVLVLIGPVPCGMTI